MSVSNTELINIAKAGGSHSRGKLYINGQPIGDDLSFLTPMFNALNAFNNGQGPKLNDVVMLRWYVGDNLSFGLSFPYWMIRAVRAGQQIVEAWAVVQYTEFSIKDGTIELLDDTIRDPKLYRRVDFSENVRRLPQVFEEILVGSTITV